MLINISRFFQHILFATSISCTLASFSTSAIAWGHDGHSAIGVLAMTQLQAEARLELASVVDPQDEQAMVEACNWPDVIRETEKWEFTSPRHYINIPRGDFEYLQSRDCPDGQCATETIKHFARELANREIDKEQRWQAFAWLCHVVGDLHQPLHAGFADDRGGNNFDIVVRGEQMNLHGFWDHELIDQHAGNRQTLVGLLGRHRPVPEGSGWLDEMVNDWTNESHELAKLQVYPKNTVIDDSYKQQSWDLAQQRLSQAAYHLAWIINTVLQEGD
jgi:hypothetical protein